MRKKILGNSGLSAAFFVMAGLTSGQAKIQRQPIIDVHLHSESLSNLKDWGPNPVTRKKAPESVEEHIKQTLAVMDRYNIVLGIVSGDLESVEQFRKSAPDRIWAGPSRGLPGLDIENLRALYKSGRLKIMGEVCAQYDGLSPSDPILDPYFALAESLDAPACVHMGMSLPGITQSDPKFRVALGNPLLLEEMLNRHPRLRVWIAHMGYPFLQETYGILGVYPQVYADISASWLGTREGFYANLREEIAQDCGKQIMFGSDQMTWPDGIGIAIEWIEKADFLSAEQKRDILYNNAARFLRLSPELIAKHHGASSK
jgi:predicted TIM-barrel fold metal-dependent hydrolase